MNQGKGGTAQTSTVNGEKYTLKSSGEDVKLHSKRVEKMQSYTRNEWGITLETGGEDSKLHSKRVQKM